MFGLLSFYSVSTYLFTSVIFYTMWKIIQIFEFYEKKITLFVYLPKYTLVPNVMYEKEKFLISLLESSTRHCTSAFRLQNSAFNYVEKLIMMSNIKPNEMA